LKVINAKLINSENIDFGDFNVFIGGNGVGKTTFILELFAYAIGQTRTKNYWVSQLEYDTDNVKEDILLLKNSMSSKTEGMSLFYYSTATKNIDGNVDHSQNLRFSQEDIKQMDAIDEKTKIINDLRYRRPFISFSSCESRLALQDEVGTIGLDQPPTDSINVLFRNKTLLEDINRTILHLFNAHFVLLSHTLTKLQLGLSKTPLPNFNKNAHNLQEECSIAQKWKEEHFTPLSEAGHGIRSMIRLLTSLLDPINQIILIDEPEMHLYPAQKRWLGRKLVELAAMQRKQVFLVTHDPIILQGILDSNTSTTIFRIDRLKNNQGNIQQCSFNKGIESTAMKNQEQFLQGLFYQRCIIVEGASDRSFYQTLFEQHQNISDKDFGFVASGGTGSTKNIVDIFSKVGAHIVFIYDFDVILYNHELIQYVYDALGGSATNIFEDLKKNFQDKQAKDKNEIKKLCDYSEKYGIRSDWAKEHQNIFTEIISSLEKVGIFIVPNGTLESWAPEVEPKVRFAEMAPIKINSDLNLRKPLEEFINKILKYFDIEETSV